MTDYDREITETVLRERGRLRSFIRRRVRDPADAEDIVQDVFYEFVEAYHLPAPIERASAWLFQVARNRIVDLFRKRKEQSVDAVGGEPDDGEPDDGEHRLDLLLPAAGSPEGDYARSVLLNEMQTALDELPPEQRDVFVAHELGGDSFRRMARESGVPMSTLLARKRYAVLHLRKRLRAIYDDLDM